MKRVIGFAVGSVLLWILIVGGSIAMNFDRIAESNRQMAELEWTLVCDDIYDDEEGDYSEIHAVAGNGLFIGVHSKEVEAVLMDERGHAVSEPYDSLEPLGDGYVRYEDTPDGVTAMGDNRKNRRTRIGVLDRYGKELAAEEAALVLEGAANGKDAGSDTEGGKYLVVQSDDGKYVGIRGGSGTWLIPPVFDVVELTDDQRYAVIRNGEIIGIALLGE